MLGSVVRVLRSGLPPLRPGRTFAATGSGLSGAGLYTALGHAFFYFLSRGPQLRAPSALRGTSGGADHDYPGGARTTLWKALVQLPTRARRTGFYPRVGAPIATRLRPFA